MALLNTHIQKVPASHGSNKRGYDILLYVPSKGKPFVVAWHEDHWHELLHDKRTQQPYIGEIREDVHQYDVLQEQTEEQSGNDSEGPGSESEAETESDSEKSNTNLQIRNSPITGDNRIFGTASGISPNTYSTINFFDGASGNTENSSPSTITQEQPPSYTMATTISTLTATTTNTPAVTSSGTGGGSGSGARNSSTVGGSTPRSTEQRVSDALATALRRPGGGGGGGNPPAGGGGGGGPPGGGGGPAANPPQVPVAPVANVKTMGTPPRDFNGDRRQARDFVEELRSYMRVNQGVAGFESPIRKVALALTFIKGPEVARWTAAMGRWIDALDQLADNIPAVWDQFLVELEEQFVDSTIGQRSRIELERLKMRFPEVDQYISKFEDLASLAGYTVGNEETINFFLRGLPDDVMTDVLKPPIVNTYVALKERAIAVTKSKQLISAIKGRQNNAFQNTFGPRPSYRPFFQRSGNYQGQRPQQRPQYTSSNTPSHMNNQPVPMDMSARTRAPVNRSFRNQFRSNAAQVGQDGQCLRPPKGPCFKCGRMGHFARECRSSTQINMMDQQEDDMGNCQDPLEPEIDRIARIRMEIGALSKEGEERLIEVLGSTEGPQQGFQQA